MGSGIRATVCKTTCAFVGGGGVIVTGDKEGYVIQIFEAFE